MCTHHSDKLKVDKLRKQGVICHRSMDPRTSVGISLPESMWSWIEAHAEIGTNGPKMSGVIEQAVRLLMEAEANDV